MRYKLLVLLLLSTLFSYSQNVIVTDTVSAFSCKGELYSSYSNKFQLLRKNYSYSNSDQKKIIEEIYKKSQADFLEDISNNKFMCDSNLQLYVKTLFDEILSKNKIDANNYNILLSKDSEVNAYNFGEGTVVLNYGLFTSLENEDELVFVISHEIGHQYMNHVRKGIETYAKNSTSEEILKRTKEIEKSKYRKATLASNLLKNIAYKNYSERRKREIEADSIGLVFYKRTLRNPKAGIKLLEKLDVSDKERDSITVADYKIVFEENGFKIKEKYFVEEESLFKKYDVQNRVNNDSLKSHPACTVRIELIKKYLNNKSANDIYTNSLNFTNIKTNSIRQNLANLFADKKYGISLYETLKHYKKDKNNTFYKEMIYLNLTELYKARINYTLNRYVPGFDKKHNTASLNRYINFLNNIKLSDFELLITNFKPTI